MRRRTFLKAAGATAAAGTVLRGADFGITYDALQRSKAEVIPVDPRKPGSQEIRISREWSDGRCASRIMNAGKQPVRVRQITLFRLPHSLPPETSIYAESFQMLSQTAGTLAGPIDLGYSETKHYRIPQPEGVRAASGLLTLTPPGGSTSLFGFSSCKRFIGRMYFAPKQIEVVIDTEGIALNPGESWDLEEFCFAQGSDRPALLSQLAQRINENHPPLRFPAPPTGWCSWYCFGPRVTAQDVTANLDAIAHEIPGLKYVQLDDGYQAAMGDWLDTGKAFGGDVLSVLKQIRQRGFEPAIWVAPFIAEPGSQLFQQHPEWFMKGPDSQPLSSDKVTFGGWRRGPWYALDGTHPDAQKHLERVFRTMRQEWGVTYFKLDANFWGAMHGGALHDPNATRIEAYRRGMEAVRRGAGDGFLLGCNHPVWPSFGQIHGSRSSADISRKWVTIRDIARQNLSRNWQNGRLWWNDPDAVVLMGSLPENEFQFHATAAYASGGMILSGDDLTKISPERLAMLKKLLPPTGIAAEFVDESLSVGVVKLADRQMLCAFNWSDAPTSLSYRLPAPMMAADFWSGEDLKRKSGTLRLENIAPRSARLLMLRPA